MPVSLESFRAGLAGANAYHLFEIENEDLAVSDLAGVRGFFDCLNDLLQQLGLDSRFYFDFGQEVHDVLRAPVELGMSFLPPEALDLGDGDARDADRGQRFTHLVELEGLDDCG